MVNEPQQTSYGIFHANVVVIGLQNSHNYEVFPISCFQVSTRSMILNKSYSPRSEQKRTRQQNWEVRGELCSQHFWERTRAQLQEWLQMSEVNPEEATRCPQTWESGLILRPVRMQWNIFKQRFELVSLLKTNFTNVWSWEMVLVRPQWQP